MENSWNSGLYDQAHSFVWKLAADLLPMLDAKPEERIIDLGCGTGHLTAEIAQTGAQVIGIDSSAEMIGQARAQYPGIDFRVADARTFAVEEPVDAVFSNAALHWVCDAEGAVRRISTALRPGGRFVAEFGGKGNVRELLAGTLEVLRAHGVEARNPWYFPSIGEYATLLERHGLEVRQAFLFDRMTALEEGEDTMRKWLAMFGGPLMGSVPEEIVVEVVERLRKTLYRDGRWFADYRRIRVEARKVEGTR